MARVLIAVEDPLCLQQKNSRLKPLLLDEYVQVHIAGRELTGVFSIPRNALRDDSSIWIASPESTLDIRAVEVLWRDRQQALIRNNVKPGERLIVSDLAAPVNGMALRTPGSEKPGGKALPRDKSAKGAERS